MNYRTFSPNSRKRAFFSDYLTFAQCAKWQPVLKRKTINFAVTTLPLYSVQNGRQFCSGKLLALQRPLYVCVVCKMAGSFAAEN